MTENVAVIFFYTKKCSPAESAYRPVGFVVIKGDSESMGKCNRETIHFFCDVCEATPQIREAKAATAAGECCERRLAERDPT